jgi:hypothetical protein
MPQLGLYMDRVGHVEVKILNQTALVPSLIYERQHVSFLFLIIIK